MKKIATKVDLTGVNVAKNMLVFALPLMLSSWLQLSFNLADYIICGFFVSELAVGAIGATGSICSLIVDLFIGLSVGVNVVISNAFGSKDKEKAERVIGCSTLIALVSGAVLAVIGLSCSRFFLEAMGTSVNMIDMSTDYMMIYFIGVPFLLLYNFSSAFLRGMGNSFKPFLYLTIGGIINVVFNIVLVLPPFNLGVKGLAIATVSSEVVSSVLCYITLFRGKEFARFELKKLRFFKSETISILKIGIPAGIQSMMFDVANVLIQSHINSFGDSTVTGDSSAQRLIAFVYTGADAFAQAGVAFVAGNIGAKKIDGIKKSMKWCIIYCVLADALLSGVELLLRKPLLGLIIHPGTDLNYYQEAMDIAQLCMYINLGSHILMALVDCLACLERGLGESNLPAIVSFIGICVVRIVYVFTFFMMPELHHMEYLYIAYPISWLITATAHGICLYFVKKKKMNALNV